MKRLVLLLILVCVSSAAMAQKVDAAFVVGESIVSDTNTTENFGGLPPTFFVTFKTGNHIFLEGAFGLRLVNAHAASLSLDVPIASIPSQTVTSASTAGTLTTPSDLSSLFITPGVRLKLLPSFSISPWVAVGGGWARYAQGSFITNKPAIEYGGGLDFKTGLPLLGFRAEVRDFITEDFLNGSFGSVFDTNSGGLHHHNVLVGGGVVFRF
ncbi:MAG TPA: hypothetical protein VFR24_03955 [Candidatus Angelobacter sp.]|nr:hypothetical protein [Candidatus Angelobacter sp.]